MTSAESLERARQAWAKFLKSEAEMGRLRGYPHMSRPMKDAFAAASNRYTEAREELIRILGRQSA
ncbi:hypothetical protein [Lysobacter antibioticus]|uniref:hypothetical protein n=1 Tax=Lysobacter antibioticus TaxID=84531 RepID=UPI00034520DA|nr:hypothetical protein [Lysobacter antibioticus]